MMQLVNSESNALHATFDLVSQIRVQNWGIQGTSSSAEVIIQMNY